MILTDITSDMQSIVESKVASINSTLTHPTDGLPPVGTVRVSFGPETTREDIDALADALLEHKTRRFPML